MKMKRLLSAVLAGIMAATMLPTAAFAASEFSVVTLNATNFPDEALLNIVKSKDLDSDGVLDNSELQRFSNLVVTGEEVKNLTGLKLLKNLQKIEINKTRIKEFDSDVLPESTGVIILTGNESLVTAKISMQFAETSYRDSSIYIDKNPRLTALEVSSSKGIKGISVVDNNNLDSVAIKNNEFLSTNDGVAINDVPALGNYVIGKNTNLKELNITSHVVSLDASECTSLTKITLNGIGYISRSDISIPDGFKVGGLEKVLAIKFLSYAGNRRKVGISEIEHFEYEKAGTVRQNGSLFWSGADNDYMIELSGDGSVWFKQYLIDDYNELRYNVNEPLTTVWEIKFATEPERAEPEAVEDVVSENIVWVNGKDVKDDKKTPDIDETKLYKTYQYQQSGMFSGGKWCVAVTTDEITTVDAFVALFTDGKVNATGKTELTNGKKRATAKIKDGLVTVSAGKETGAVNVWVYEVKKNAETKKNEIVNTGNIKPYMKTVSVIMAPGSPILAEALTDGVAAKGVSKLDLAPNDTKTLYLGDKKATFSKHSTFIFENSDDTVAEATFSDNKLTVKALKEGKAVITITAVQSDKKVKLTVNCKKPKTK